MTVIMPPPHLAAERRQSSSPGREPWVRNVSENQPRRSDRIALRGSQDPLCRGNPGMLHTRGRVQRARGRLENGFCDVMLVPAVQIFDVEIETAFLHKCL